MKFLNTADEPIMDRSQISAENEVRYLLSLLRISHPGEPASEQTAALEELLRDKTTR